MSSMRCSWLCGISRSFLLLSPAQGQVTYVLLTRSPLIFRRRFVRLACIRHAASVHPEPGSNSQKYISICFVCVPSYSNNLDVLLSFQRSFQPLFCKGFLHSFVKCVLNIPHTDTYVNNFFEIFSFFLIFFQKNVFLAIL